MRRPLLRWFALSATAVMVLGLGVALGSAQASALEWSPGTTDHGSLSLSGGAPVLVLEGPPAAQGQAMGTLTDAPLRKLIRVIRLGQVFADGERLKRLRAAVPPAIAEELVAAATAAGVDPEALITANLVVDSHCSALVAPPIGGQPLRVARNMDFFPAKLLGPGTVLTVWRRPGVRTVIGVGWPGYAGIVSGMNDAGLSVCILLQHGAPEEADGIPLAFRLRQVLETCTSVEEAAAALKTQPPASRHYVLLADATTSAVVWREGDRQHRDDPQEGWLMASNGPRQSGLPQDVRGRCLTELGGVCRTSGAPPTEAWLRRALTASYMKGINAQAMILIPERRELQLATGSGWKPAALSPWRTYDLRPLFAREIQVTAQDLGRVEDPLPWGAVEKP